MDQELDRRELTLGFIMASFVALTARPEVAHATGGAVLDQPWAVWAKDVKPVRGGTFRIAAEQYIGQMEMFFGGLAWYLQQNPRRAQALYDHYGISPGK